MKVAVTGNIGSGKSTFSAMLKEAMPEFDLINVDQIVHDLYSDDMFCRELLAKFGTFNKKEVSDLVFINPDDRKWLEDMAGKRVDLRLNSLINYSYTNTIVEFPLLFEYSRQLDYDKIITVFCDEETQIERVRERNHFNDDKIKSIIGVQLSTEMKKLLAHHTVDSNCTLAELRTKASELSRTIRSDGLRDRFIRDKGDFTGYQLIWKEIEKAYTQEHRGYHVLAHLGNMFALYDRIRHKLKHPQIVEMAIWFHDFVYNTDQLYAENERASVQAMVELFYKHLGRSISSMKERDLPVLACAGEFILATKGHKITSPYVLSRPDLKRDCEVFLDLDLSVTFGDADTIKWFEDGVRKEFKQYDVMEYAQGRAKALSAFLDRPSIMLSDLFADKEAEARKNLEKIVTNWRLVGGV
jgi:dephospho-CoA kinase